MSLELNFVNVGNGDCILISENGKNFLVDAGSSEKSEFSGSSTGRICCIDFLKFRKIRKIDAVISTHIHEDHICGFEPVFECENIEIGKFLQPFAVSLYSLMKEVETPDNADNSQRLFIKAMNSYRKLCGLTAKKNILQQLCVTEDWQSLDSCLSYKIIGPELKREKNTEDQIRQFFSAEKSDFELLKKIDAQMNSCSINLYLEYAGVKILLPGDAGFADYPEKLETARIMKSGHHGQKNSLSQELLDKIQPELVIIPASSDCRYNSAAPETLELLFKNKCTAAFTDCPPTEPFKRKIPPHYVTKIEISESGEISGKYLDC